MIANLKSSAPVTFKQWRRKGFAVFSSLKLVVRIGALSITYLAFANHTIAQNNQKVQKETTQSLTHVDVDEVVVSAQRSPVLLSESPRILTIIRREEIQQSPARNLAELLDYVAGVDVRQRGTNGVQADLSIRGSSFDQVLVLINGISMNDPQTGHHNLNLPLNTDLIERIEILEGPSSRIYGPNAFSGAINIITRKFDQSEIQARLSYGNYNSYEGGISAGLITGKISNGLSINRSGSDGAVQNTDYKRTNLYYSLHAKTGSFSHQLQTGYTNNQFGANSFYTPAYPNQYEQVKTGFVSFRSDLTKENSQLVLNGFWRKNVDRFELFRDYQSAPSWYKNHNYHTTDVFGLTFKGWQRVGVGKIAYGADYRNEMIMSNVLGTPMKSPVPIPGVDNLKYTNQAQRYDLSFFGEYSLNFSNLSISTGLLANLNESTRQLLDLYPGFDLKWTINEQFSLLGSVNRSMRMPTFTDLYYKSATNIGNDQLKPEEAIAYELGVTMRQKWFYSEFQAYSRSGKNLIDWARKKDETLWHAMNINELQTYGIDATASVLLNELFHDQKFFNRLSVSYSFIDQKKQPGEYISKYVLDYLKHKVSISLNNRITRNLTVDWKVNYQDRSGTFTKWETNHYGEEVPYNPVWLIDMRACQRFKSFNLFAEANNLLNSKYYDYGNILQSGSYFKVGIELKFSAL